MKHKIKQAEGDDDGGSGFKLTARGQQGLKSHMLVGSICATRSPWQLRDNGRAPNGYCRKKWTKTEELEKLWKTLEQSVQKNGPGHSNY